MGRTLVVKKMKRTEQRMEWWKLGKGRVVLPDVWRTTANVIRGKQENTRCVF